MKIRHVLPITGRFLFNLVSAKLRGRRLYVEISVDNLNDDPTVIYTAHYIAGRGKPNVEIDKPAKWAIGG